VPVLRLFSYHVSSSAWRVRIALELKSIDYQIEAVDLQVREDERGPEGFSRASLLKQVPALAVPVAGGERVLTQSLAIIAYLDETHPNPPLLPSDPLTRAFARECAEMINAGIQPLQNIRAQQKIRELGSDPTPFVHHFVRRGLVALESKLSSLRGPFALGEQVGLIDVCLIPQLFASRRFGVPLDGLSRLLEIEANCAGLPPFVRAHPDAQPDRPA
jgi:maleylpyruvate isomerase